MLEEKAGHFIDTKAGKVTTAVIILALVAGIIALVYALFRLDSPKDNAASEPASSATQSTAGQSPDASSGDSYCAAIKDFADVAVPSFSPAQIAAGDASKPATDMSDALVDIIQSSPNDIAATEWNVFRDTVEEVRKGVPDVVGTDEGDIAAKATAETLSDAYNFAYGQVANGDGVDIPESCNVTLPKGAKE